MGDKMKKMFYTNSADETIGLGEKIGAELEMADVVLLTGDLSAGKTTITKGIGKAIGVKKVINSPTFTIVKQYMGKCPLYHLDLYRLNGLNNDFDLEEYIEGDGICVIEWPFQVEEILPESYLEIKIERIDEISRAIEVIAHGDRYSQLVNKI